MNEETQTPSAIDQVKEQANVVEAQNTADPSVIPQGEKMLAAIGYFSFLCVLPLLLKPNSKFCQFHGKQGLAITIVFMIFGVFMWMFAWFWSGVYSLLGLVHFLVAVLGIMDAFKGKMTKLPFFSQIAEKFDW